MVDELLWMKFINSKVGVKICERVWIFVFCFFDSYVLIFYLFLFRYLFMFVCLIVYDEDSVEVVGNSFV